MGAELLPPGYRYRHVVFAAAAPRRPLNLGAAAAPALPAAAAALSAPDGPGQPSDDEDAFAAWLFCRAGLSARHYRAASLRRRVPACLRALRVANVAEARRAIWRDPALVRPAVDALLIGVTGFFRNAAVFGATFQQLLPRLADPGRRLRVWSAACSEGAELYSVAVLLAELNVLHRCDLLGTDCRGEAVARAAAGAFEATTCQAMPPDLLGRYFVPEPAAAESTASARLAFAAQPWLRERITWRAADVLDGPEPGPWDLILCRNMAMYLQPHAAERLWRSLARALTPDGGLLVTGKAERPDAKGGGGGGASRLTRVAPCVYRRGEAP